MILRGRWCSILSALAMVTGIGVSFSNASFASDDKPSQSAADAIVTELSSVEDGTRFFDEPALYALLDAAASESSMSEGESVAWRELVERPSRWRGLVVVLDGLAIESAPLPLTLDSRGSDRAFVTLLVTPEGHEPFQVVTLEEPPAAGTRLRASGRFFKFRRDLSRADEPGGEPNEVLVPILVSRALSGRSVDVHAGRQRSPVQLLVVLVLFMAVVYYALSRLSRRGRRPMRRRRYVPATDASGDGRDQRPIDLDRWEG